MKNNIDNYVNLENVKNLSAETLKNLPFQNTNNPSIVNNHHLKTLTLESSSESSFSTGSFFGGVTGGRGNFDKSFETSLL